MDQPSEEWDLESLASAGIIHEVAPSNYSGARRLQGLAETFNQERAATETEATKFITYLGSRLEAAVIRAFCRVAGVEYQPEMLLISGTDYRQRMGSGGNRAIDMVVIEKRGENGLGQPAARIAVEAKFDAWINGGWGYCDDHDPSLIGKYAAQSTCYAAGHLGGDLNPTKIPFIWLDLNNGNDQSIFERKGISARDPAKFDEARIRQREAEALWRHMSWGDVWEALDASISDPVLASKILNAAGRTPERSRRIRQFG